MVRGQLNGEVLGKKPCSGKTFVVDQRFWLGMLSQDGVLVNHPTMGRAMKPKQQFLTALLSCGRAQIQASGWKPEVID